MIYLLDRETKLIYILDMGKSKNKKRSNGGGNSRDNLDSKKQRSLDTLSAPIELLPKALQCLEVLEYIPAIFDDPQMKAFRASVFPLLQRQRLAHFETRVVTEEVDKSKLNAENIAATISLAIHCNKNHDDFDSIEMKDFRRALHPLVKHVHQKEGAKASNTEPEEAKKTILLSALFQAKKWDEALMLSREWATSIVTQNYREET